MDFILIDPEIPGQTALLTDTGRQMYAGLYNLMESDPLASMVVFLRDDELNTIAVVICDNTNPNGEPFVEDEDASIIPDAVAWAIMCSRDNIPDPDSEDFREWLESASPYEPDDLADTLDLAQFVAQAIGAVLLDTGNQPVDPDWVQDWTDEDDEQDLEDDDLEYEYDDEDDDLEDEDDDGADEEL